MSHSSDPVTLAAAMRELGIELPEPEIERIDRYRNLLWKWNECINLTRHVDMSTFVSRDVVDSVELARLLAPKEEVLDVGSGGGVPGILLSILRADLDVSLSESTQKKARILESMVDQLGLGVAVHAGRAENVLEDLRFDSVVARAVGPLWKICTWFAPRWDSMSRLLLIKGPAWVKERAAARERGLLTKLNLRKVAEYPMVGTYSHSVILELSKR